MSPPCTAARMQPRRAPWRIRSSGLLLVAGAVLAGCDDVVVMAASVVTVEVEPTEITLLEGGQVTATATAREGGGREVVGQSVTWTVDDPEIATVTSAGLVEGRAPGTTRIHATVDNVTGAASVVVLADPGPPEEDACEVRNRTFPGDLAIAEGTSCTYINVWIRGDLKLGRGSTLIGTDLRVDGSIEAKAATHLTLTTSRVHGDLEFEEGGSVFLRQTVINGNLQLESNNGSLDVGDNSIDGNVQVFRNRGGPFIVSDNRIDGDLQCKENDPPPTGGGNIVDGSKEDQCRTL
jgi:hypothetical protein